MHSNISELLQFFNIHTLKMSFGFVMKHNFFFKVRISYTQNVILIYKYVQ